MNRRTRYPYLKNLLSVLQWLVSEGIPLEHGCALGQQRLQTLQLVIELRPLLVVSYEILCHLVDASQVAKEILLQLIVLRFQYLQMIVGEKVLQCDGLHELRILVEQGFQFSERRSKLLQQRRFITKQNKQQTVLPGIDRSPVGMSR